jgi:mRNA-degrading endonuclease RelE of RelBE toxin-antitoxin system
MLTILTVNPSLESHARVKLLEQPAPTQYRLRVGKVRVFYDIRDENSVWVERILYEKEAHVYGRITDEDAQ